MTLIYIAWGKFDGFRDVLKCSEKHAGCPIYIVQEALLQECPEMAAVIPMSNFPVGLKITRELENFTTHWFALSVARWFVLLDFIHTYRPKFPVFCSDWDVMIFRSLSEACAPFMEHDYCVSIQNGNPSAAYVVNRVEPLEYFCKTIRKMLDENDPGLINLQDMFAWKLISNSGKFNIGDLSQIKNDSIFDHNIHCGAKQFEMDGPAKKVVWEKGRPFFVQTDGKVVRANTIHCWGTYKTRTAEVLESAGIKCPVNLNRASDRGEGESRSATDRSVSSASPPDGQGGRDDLVAAQRALIEHQSRELEKRDALIRKLMARLDQAVR